MGSVKAIKSMIEEAGGPDVRRQRLVLRDGTMLQDDSHASDIPPGEGVTVVEMQPQTVKLTGVVRRRLTLIGDERANDVQMMIERFGGPLLSNQTLPFDDGQPLPQAFYTGNVLEALQGKGIRVHGPIEPRDPCCG